MELKQCTPGDLAQLRALSEETYRETFAPYNTAADMDAYVAGAFSEARLRDELADAHTAFFMALDGGAAAGYIKLCGGPAQSEPGMDGGMEIGRLYALGRYHGTGLGGMLMDHAAACAREAGCSFLWLGVWEHNHRALRFYGKHGFVRFGQHPFVLGADVQTDFLMRRELRG